MLTRTGVVLVALAIAAGVGAAQERVLPSVPQSLSLHDAVELAQRYNPLYRQTANDRGGAEWAVRSSYGDFVPSITLSGGLSYAGTGSQTFLSTEFSQPSSTIGSSYSLGFGWQFSGTTLMQPGLRKAQLHAVEATIGGARINLRSVVEQQYLAVLQAQAQVEISRVQVTRNEEFLRLAQARYQVGQATMLDVRQAEVAKGQADVALLRSRQAVTVAKLRLFQQIGIPAPDDPGVVALSDTFPVTAPRWSLQELLSDAQAGNPDLTALRAQESAARWSVRSAKSTWLPSLSFSAGLSGFTQQYTNVDPLVRNAVTQAQAQAASDQFQCAYANGNWLNAGGTPIDCSVLAFTDAQAAAIRSGLEARNRAFPFDFTRQPFSARIGISLPLFDQFSRPLQVTEASARADDAREAVRARELNVRTEVSQAYYGLLTAHETIRIQETGQVAAQEQLRLATERYRVGSGTFFELLDAQVASQRADSDYVNAVYDYHRAVAALESAVGRSLR